MVSFDLLWPGACSVERGNMVGFSPPATDVGSVDGGTAVGFDPLSPGVGSVEAGVLGSDPSSAGVGLWDSVNAVGRDRHSLTVGTQGCKSLLGNDPIGNNRSSTATRRSRTSRLDGFKNGRARVWSQAVMSKRMTRMDKIRTNRSAMLPVISGSCVTWMGSCQ